MTGDWQRLADHVISRRTHQDYDTQELLAAAAGVALKTVGRLERGESVSNSTLSKIERALSWAPGSMRAILAGGDPTELPDPTARLNEHQKQIARATFNEWRNEYGDKQARKMLEEVLDGVPESTVDDRLQGERDAR